MNMSRRNGLAGVGLRLLGVAVAVWMAGTGAGAQAVSRSTSGGSAMAGQPASIHNTSVVIPYQWGMHVIERRYHEDDAFTQGLVLYNNILYESTGLYGQSSLRKLNPKTGVIIRQIDLPDTIFAEGLARVDDRLIQITWKEKKAFVYDLKMFEQTRDYDYSGEGWGLCLDEAHKPRRLVMSDGSDTLFYRDPDTFELIGSITVTRAGVPLHNLNELECVGQSVYANVWQTDTIVRIDKDSGIVTAEINAFGLLTNEERAGHNPDVLNGIAYDPDTKHFLITGKQWPKLYEVTFTGTDANNPGGGIPNLYLPQLRWDRR